MQSGLNNIVDGVTFRGVLSDKINVQCYQGITDQSILRFWEPPQKHGMMWYYRYIEVQTLTCCVPTVQYKQ